MSTHIHRATLTALIATAAFALTTLPAAATPGGLTYLSSFNGSDNPSMPGGFAGPRGMTVDQTNRDVYVADTETPAYLLDIFNSAGVFRSQIAEPTFNGGSVGVNDGTSEAYVGDNGTDHVDVFDSAGALEAEWNGSVTPSGSFGGGNVFVAVDNSATASKGDVYVADDEHNVVDRLNAAGEPVSFSGTASYVSGSQLTGTPEGPFRGPEGLAVDNADGDIYVNDHNEAVDVFSGSGEYLYSLKGATFAPDKGRPLSIAVDGVTGSVYVTDPGQGVLYVFDAVGELEYQVSGTPGGAFGEPVGVAVDEASGDVYVGDYRLKRVDVFGPGPLPPVANTDAASGVTGSSVVLHGDLNPGGVSAGYYFTYARGAGCIGSSTVEGSAGAGSADVSEEAVVGGLEPHTVYTFCFYATVGQSERSGAPVTFETAAVAPAVDDQATSVSGLTPTEAVLHGAVNANNEETTYYFNYGLTSGYGSTSVTPPGTSIGGAFGDQPVSGQLVGLVANTTYHYQLVAVNAAGESRSPDETFTTLPYPAVLSGVAVSAVSGVSATLTGTVDPGATGQGLDETVWCFEYGTESYYDLGYLPGRPGSVAPGTTGVPVSVQLTGLQPGTTYHYRLVAVNAVGVAEGAAGCHIAAGQQSASADGLFTTTLGGSPPGVATGGASAIAPGSATVSGSVQADGYRTSYEFQVGIDTSYGADVFGEAGEGSEPQPVSLDLVNLQPGTTYHYRLVATNRDGTSYGADQTFTTPVFPSATLAAPAAAALVATPALVIPSLSLPPGTAVKQKTTKKAKGKHKQKTKRKRKGRRKGSGARGGHTSMRRGRG